MTNWDKNSNRYSFEDLKSIMKRLRSKDGCPWDQKQTHNSLKHAALEEVYEVIEAIDNEDMANLREELGDVLLQVVFHAQIATEHDAFDVEDVIHELCEKLIRRHPHVFSNPEEISSEEVITNWNAIKQVEKNHISVSEDMKKIPKAMPALMRAVKVQKKATEVNFDFKEVADAMAKVYEEIEEFKEACEEGDFDHMNEEYGDLLFGIVNISRFFKLNPEFSLTNATEKFINRFEGIENLARKQGLSIRDMTLEDMDKLWEQLKNQ